MNQFNSLSTFTAIPRSVLICPKKVACPNLGGATAPQLPASWQLVPKKVHYLLNMGR